MKQNIAKRKNFETHAFQQLEDLYRTAMYVSENEPDAQELVQESFVRAYLSWHEYKHGPDGRVWLFKIMVNILINKYRNKYCASPDLPAAKNSVDEIGGYLAYSRWVNQQPIDDSGQDPLSAISEDHVRKAIGNLPPEFRLIVVLSLLEGFSYQEIADIAGINLETVRSRLHQGRKLMQREIFDHVVYEGEDKMPAGRVRSRKSG